MGQGTAVTLGTQPPNYALRVTEGIARAGHHALEVHCNMLRVKRRLAFHQQQERPNSGVPPSPEPRLEPTPSSVCLRALRLPKASFIIYLIPCLLHNPPTCLFHCAVYLGVAHLPRRLSIIILKSLPTLPTWVLKLVKVTVQPPSSAHHLPSR